MFRCMYSIFTNLIFFVMNVLIMYFFSLFGLHTVHNADVPARRVLAGKVRATNFPQEYQLSRFIEDVKNPHSLWNSSNHACDWKGVTCQDDLQVTGIDWRDMDLKGSLHWDWLPYSLLSFSGTHNKLSGEVVLNTLPPHLSYFDATKNFFSGKLDLCHFTHSLQHFLINTNKLEGSLDLTQLPPHLEHLGISRNKFSGAVRFDRLPPSLLYFDLSHNTFTGPLHVQNLPSKLQAFFCNNNCFSGLVLIDNLPTQLEHFTMNMNFRLFGRIDKSILPATLLNFNIANTKIFLTRQ